MKMETEINLLPIISVSLILVLVLMIISPHLNQSKVNVELPKAESAGTDNEAKVTITLTKDKQLLMDEKRTSFNDLRLILSKRLLIDPYKLVVVKMDKGLEYRDLENILDILKKVNVRRLAIATAQKREDKGILFKKSSSNKEEEL